MVLIPNVPRALLWILIAPLWIACIGGLAYWHWMVAPGLDASEGCGVAFGGAAVGCTGPLVAVVFTTLIFAADRLLKLHSRPGFVPL